MGWAPFLRAGLGFGGDPDPTLGAVALHAAGRSLGEQELEGRAFSVMEAAATRSLEASGVIDACLCHGSSGLGHICNRLYQASGRPALRDAAVRWFEWTLAQHGRRPELGTFASYDKPPGQEGGFYWTPGFLEGTAGIGLGLLAAATDVEPGWDRVLLMS